VQLILPFGGGVLLPLLPPEVMVFELGAKRLAGTFPGLVRYYNSEEPWSLQAIMWRPRQRRLLRASLRIFYPRAVSVVAVSRGAAADVERLACMKPGSVEVIYTDGIAGELPLATGPGLSGTAAVHASLHGGAVTTNDPQLADSVRTLGNYDPRSAT
jgi:hypothetical protein